MVIETTRPELIPACVALVAHPDDDALPPLFGTEVRTPLFGVPVPVVAHPLADPEKGTGIAMICTFGDTTDVTWWRELRSADAHRDRPRRSAARRPPDVGRDAADAARDAYAELAGKTVKQAQARDRRAARASRASSSASRSRSRTR